LQWQACLDRAHQRYTTEMSDARRTYQRSAMPAESAEDRREDAYDAARDHCESLRGAAEDQCIADARAPRMTREPGLARHV
jgi:hypothetical protein